VAVVEIPGSTWLTRATILVEHKIRSIHLSSIKLKSTIVIL